MTARVLNILRVSRRGVDETEESLEFSNGVNVLLGENNAGKTIWMRQIDFLMGDDITPRHAFDVLSTKYLGLTAEIAIGSVLHRIDRVWGTDPTRSKMYLDSMAISPDEFSEFMLQALGLPELRYPKGSIVGEKTWPRLSWRTLLRQLYRREDSWNDIAYRQPEGEQFAVLAQFLGIASSIFSSEFTELGERLRRKAELQSRKHHFELMLNEIARELISSADISIEITRESLDQATSDLDLRLQALQNSREQALLSFQDSFLDIDTPVETAQLSQQLSEFQRSRQNAAESEAEGRNRSNDLKHYRSTLLAERDRLERARRAGHLIGPLRVTHCPVCDQSVEHRVPVPGVCYLCGQAEVKLDRGDRERLDFEIQQLSDETSELAELIEKIDSQVNEARRYGAEIDDHIGRIGVALNQLTARNSWRVSPDVSQLDRDIGALIERTRHIDRIRSTLELRQRIESELQTLTEQIRALEDDVLKQKAFPNYAAIGDLLGEAISDYLSELNEVGQDRWGERKVTVDVSPEAVLLLVNGRRWSAALGANLRAYFFMALHYALLKLSTTDPFLYPGFLLLDFPANLGQHTGLSNEENYLLVPIIRLLQRPELRDAQVIAAGRSFQGLGGARVVQLGQPY